MAYLLIILSIVFQTLSPNGGLSFDGVKSICQDRSGFMWITLREDVYRYDGYTYLSYANRVTGNTGELFFRQVQVEDGLLYLSTSRGEYVYNEQCDSFLLASSRPQRNVAKEENQYKLPSTKVVLSDQHGQIWVGTQKGLYVINPITNEREWYLSSNSGLVNSSVWSLYNDHQGYMWVGTYAGGVSLAAYMDNQPVHTFDLQDIGLSRHAVSSFAWDGIYLWTGTEGGGLLQLRAIDNTFQMEHRYTTQNSKLSSNNVNSLLVKNNKLWIGSYMGGLDCLNLTTRMIRHVDLHRIYDYQMADHIKKLLPDGDHGMWIISSRTQYQLLYYSFDEQSHYVIQMPNSDKEYEYDIFVDGVVADSALYVATCNRIFRLLPGERMLKEIYRSDELISALYYQSEEQSLWLGTQRRGVVKLDLNTYQVDRYTEMLKYDEPIVYSMTMDSARNLWMGTTKGIIRFSTRNQQTSQYDEIDGVQSSTCYPMSVFVDENGRIFFGGNDGFTSFCPSEMTTNSFAPTLLLSAKPQTRLKYEDNDVVLELACTAYWKSAKNRYRYRLLGLQNQWVEVSSRQRVVRYEHLPIGHYTFEACASNSDGTWGSITRYSFQVCPAWWNGWWAWLIYALVIGGAIGYIIFTSIRHRRMKNELYKVSIQQQEEEKANRAKVRFFTDVNKEIRGPLLQLQSMLDMAHTPYIQQMLDTMTKYTDKYCIDTGNHPKEQKIDQDLRRLTDLIDQGIANHIDIDELAREMGMSRRKLFSFVKDNTGKSIIEYIRAYRISTAAKLLVEKNLPMLEVMDRVGIDSQSYFIKTFKKEYGMNPSEFIAKMSNQNT